MVEPPLKTCLEFCTARAMRLRALVRNLDHKASRRDMQLRPQLCIQVSQGGGNRYLTRIRSHVVTSKTKARNTAAEPMSLASPESS